MSRAFMEELVNRALNLSGMPSVALDEGGYALVHVAGMAVNLEYDEIRERLYLYASLGKLPDSVPVALYEAVLEAGFMGRAPQAGISACTDRHVCSPTPCRLMRPAWMSGRWPMHSICLSPAARNGSAR